MAQIQNKIVLPLIIAGGAIAAYFLSSGSTGVVTTSITPVTGTPAIVLPSGWSLDKNGLDLLDYTEQTFATKIWSKAQPYMQMIFDYGKEFNVFVPLTLSIIFAESAFDPNAKRYEASLGESSVGLMQILPSTAKGIGWYGTDQDLANPVNNLRYGIKYIGYQLDRYGRDLNKTAAAYNAGSAKYLANGKFINQFYVDKVVSNYNIIKTAIVKR